MGVWYAGILSIFSGSGKIGLPPAVLLPFFFVPLTLLADPILRLLGLRPEFDYYY